MEQFAELGCVCLLLTRLGLKQGWINSGIIKTLYISLILKHSCNEPVVVASGYMKNLSM